MGFLSPFLLSGLAVLAVPLWLHLRRKRRHAPVEFPSLRYLKMAAARMKRQARVEDVGLLLLRLLLVALLAAAFARPVVRSGGGWLGAGRAVESVIVIDATASMGWRGETGSRLDAAKRMAREWADGFDRSDAVALWVLTDRLEKPVPLPISDRAHWVSRLDALEPSEGSSSLAPVFNAAREWAETRSAGRKELVVITDNQAAAWDWPAEGFFLNVWKSDGTSLVVLTPDDHQPPNTSVVTVVWEGKAVRAGSLLVGVAKLVNHGDVPARDLLEVRSGGEVLLRKPVELAANGSLDVPLSLAVPVLDGAVFSGEIALAGDALACDDRWHFSLPARRLARSLVVERGGGPGGGMRPSFFLTKALAAGGAGRADAIETPAWSAQSTDGIDSVWFTGGAITSDAAWRKAVAFAEAGGTIVITGDSQPDPLPGDWPVTAGPEINLPAARIATRLLAPAHPMFGGVWGDQTPFPPLPQGVARDCAPAGGAKLLGTLAGGFPLLVEQPRGKGRILWLNASADRSWGDLPLSPAFVVLVQQMARARELAMQTVTSAWVGEAWPDLGAFSGDAVWAVPEEAKRVQRSGVFDAVSKDGTVQWRCAVNVRREESDLHSLDAAKLQAMLPGRVEAGTQGLREWRKEIRRDVPLWPWLLAAAALVFLAEGWAGSWFAKRREISSGGETPKWFGRRAGA